MKKVIVFLLVLSFAVLFVSCKTAENEETTLAENKISTSDYSFDIPENFEVKSDGNELLLENENGTIQLNITDKTAVVKDFDTYINDTYNAAETSGIAAGGVEEITLNEIPMKRFSMEMENDTETRLISYIYFLEINNKVLMITLTSKDGEIKDVSQADSFVSDIDFQNNL